MAKAFALWPGAHKRRGAPSVRPTPHRDLGMFQGRGGMSARGSVSDA